MAVPGRPEGLADDGVDFFDLQVLLNHQLDGIGNIKDADAVADEVGDVLADNDTLAQHLLTEFDHVSDDFLISFPRRE